MSRAVFDRSYYEANQQAGDRPALRWYARVCHRLMGGAEKEIFDFGCGTGWLMHHLVSYGHRVSGFDEGEYSRQSAGKLVPDSTLYDNLSVVPRGRYDLVVSLHVLEHVPDPEALVAQLADLLKPNGHLMFVVPARNGLGHRIRGDEWFAFRDESHISLLEEREWRAIVRGSGMRIVQEAGDGLWDPPYVPWLPRWFQLALFGSPAAVQVYLGRGRLFVPAAWSECLIVVAQSNEARPGD